MKADHVVLDTKTGEFWCRHCDARYHPTLPASIDMFVAMTKEFSKSHRNCKPRPSCPPCNHNCNEGQNRPARAAS